MCFFNDNPYTVAPSLYAQASNFADSVNLDASKIKYVVQKKKDKKLEHAVVIKDTHKVVSNNIRSYHCRAGRSIC